MRTLPPLQYCTTRIWDTHHVLDTAPTTIRERDLMLSHRELRFRTEVKVAAREAYRGAGLRTARATKRERESETNRERETETNRERESKTNGGRESETHQERERFILGWRKRTTASPGSYGIGSS